MNYYMASISLPATQDEKYLAQLPRQKEIVDKLMAGGMIASYSLSIDRKRLWVIVVADNEKKARRIINEFPLRKFMDIRISKLKFHSSLSFLIPQLFLN